MNWLIDTTVYLSVTAIFLIVFKYIFKNKLPARWHLALWVILLIRFFAPALPSSDISIFNAVKNFEYMESDNDNIADINAEFYDESIPLSETNEDKNITESIVLTIWKLGIYIMISYFFAAYMYLSYKISKKEKITDPKVYDMLEECKNELKVRKKVFMVNSGGTPMLKGIIKPVILLNEGLSDDENRNILIHELCHLKHYDILILWIALLFLCINWYNPIIWYSFFLLKRDVEVYCDERALKHIENKKEYASLLLKTAMNKNKFILGTTSLNTGEKDVERRIKYIAYFKKPKIMISALLILLIGIITAVCLTNSSEKIYEEDIEKTVNISEYNGGKMSFLYDTSKVVSGRYNEYKLLKGKKTILADDELWIKPDELEGKENTLSYGTSPTDIYGFDIRIRRIEEVFSGTVYNSYFMAQPQIGGMYSVITVKKDEFSEDEIQKLLSSVKFNVSKLYDKVIESGDQLLKNEAVLDKEIIDKYIVNWAEAGNGASFTYNVVYKDIYNPSEKNIQTFDCRAEIKDGELIFESTPRYQKDINLKYKKGKVIE